MEKNGSTYTFTDKDGNFKTTVKSEYLKIIPNPEEVPYDKLMTDHDLPKYIHNPNGPALHVIKNGYEEYWIDGKRASDEVANQIKHNLKAANELEDILDGKI